jgi:TetR/AcrR family transcriptional regulator, cholesterol catabolism regulator
MEEKKTEILKSVGKLFHRYGLRSVTMDDVASELRISKKTLYQYFKNKEELVSEVIDYFIENPGFHLTGAPTVNPIDKVFTLRKHIAGFLKSYNNNLDFDLKKQYPAIYRKVKEFKRLKIFRDTMTDIEEGKRLGLFRESLDPEFIAKLNVGRILLTFNPEQGIFSDRELSSIDWFDKTIDYHFHGICTEKGLKYYEEQLLKLRNEQ